MTRKNVAPQKRKEVGVWMLVESKGVERETKKKKTGVKFIRERGKKKRSTGILSKHLKSTNHPKVVADRAKASKRRKKANETHASI